METEDHGTLRFEILTLYGPSMHGPKHKALWPSQNKCPIFTQKSLKRFWVCKSERVLREIFCVEAPNFRLHSRGWCFWYVAQGHQGPLCWIWGPWDLSRKIPLTIYFIGFAVTVLWTWLWKGQSTRGCHLRLIRGPWGGQKSLVTLLIQGSKGQKRDYAPPMSNRCTNTSLHQ